MLCFDEKNKYLTPEKFEQDDLDSLVRYQFNYIYNFCVQFYKGIANERTVIDAFRNAKAWIDVENNQVNHIWQSKKLPFTIEDLNIKAVLIDEQNMIHCNKIFDSILAENEVLNLKPGKVLDTSRMRGQLLGMTRKCFSYVGHKVDLH